MSFCFFKFFWPSVQRGLKGIVKCGKRLDIYTLLHYFDGGDSTASGNLYKLI